MSSNTELSEDISHFYEGIGKEIDSRLKKFPITCKKGCFHCCHLLNIVTLMDGLYLAIDLLSKPDWQSWLPELRRQSKMHCYKGVNRESWFEKKEPCLFLKDGLCSVYEKRPASCRFHYVISPPEKCSPDAPKDVETAKVDMLAAEEAVADLSLQINKELGSIMAPLPLMVLWCMMLLSAKDKERLKVFEPFVKDVMDPGDWLAKNIVGLFKNGTGIVRKKEI